MTDKGQTTTIGEDYAFQQFVGNPERLSEEGTAVAIARIVNDIIENRQASTLQGLMTILRKNVSNLLLKLKGHPVMNQRTTLTINSICQIMVHCISKRLRKIDSTDLNTIRKKIAELCQSLIVNFKNSKLKLSEFAGNILKNGDTILVIGGGSLLEHIILSSAQKGKRFKVVITEGRPCCEGYNLYQKLKEKHIPCQLITDNSIGYSLEYVDYVITSAEAVTENGGIINRLGTYTAALCAKSLSKPFYVAAENFKFSRLFPLNQNDLPESTKTKEKFDFFPGKGVENNEDLVESQLCDFTPPEFITMLITDTGILTPSAISDELIQMFNI